MVMLGSPATRFEEFLGGDETGMTIANGMEPDITSILVSVPQLQEAVEQLHTLSFVLVTGP